ncbi:MAG: hypothetical protein EA401_13460 [Planctomycetota bacterium]|nr:MAG: hypothetical protein EA401_13460 [Planctomycetota bacterium]
MVDPTHDPSADEEDAPTRPTQPPPRPGAEDATLPAGQHPGLAETVLAHSHGDDSLGAAPTHATQAKDSVLPTARAVTQPGEGSGGRAAVSGMSLTGRTIRARSKDDLPDDAKTLDIKLQTSRTSVLADVTLGSGGRYLPQEAADLGDGETIGRYAVERPLAAGGMGAVLEINDHDFRRHAAMKVIHSQHAQRQDALERFLAEAQVTAQLEHPNIVPIHDMGVMADGTLYFTMKLIEGQSLGAVIKQLRSDDASQRAAAQQEWTLENKLLAFLKVLDGVGFAHDRSVVHRDIKPDNIMIGAHGEVLVVDWGIAKVLHQADRDDPLVRQVESLRDSDGMDMTLQGQVMGTVQYMPPEQAAGQVDAIDARSDIYSLGATLYELLCLRRSVTAGNVQAVLTKVMIGDIVRLDAVDPELPADVVAIVHKSMALEQDQRYPSCAAMADDLRRFLAGQAVAARRRNSIERFGAFVQRHRGKVLAATTVVVLSAAAVIATMQWQSQQAQRTVDGLLTTVDQTLESAPSLSALRGASEKLAQARALLPADPRLADLAPRVQVAISEGERHAAEEQGRQRALSLLADGRDLLQQGNFSEAAETLTAAFRLHPEHPEIEATLARARDGLRDEALAQMAREAAAARRAGDAALAQAQDLPPEDDQVDTLISQAEQYYALAEQNDMAPSGTAEQVATAALLRRQVAEARQQRAAEEAGEAAFMAAQEALAADDLERASALAAQALGHLPGDERCIALRDAVRDRLREEERQRQQAAQAAAARLAASEFLQRGQEIWQQAQTLRRETIPSQEATVADLQRRLRNQPREERQPLWQARDSLREYQREMLDLRSQAEAALQAAVAQLSDEPNHVHAQHARALLAEVYFQSWQESRARRDHSAAAAFRDLVRRYDVAGTLIADDDGQAQLRIDGGGESSVQLQALTVGGDGRFHTHGPVREMPIAEAVAVDAGRWQLSDGRTRISVHLSADESQTFTWPAALPDVPHHSFQLVYRGPDEGGSFFLDGNPTTHAAYAAFIRDPEIWSQVQAAWREVVFDDSGTAALRFLPRSGPAGDTIWQMDFRRDDPGQLQGFVVPDDLAQQPVVGINRHDAEAYAQWLSQQAGVPIRLPTQAEWHHAATAGDDERLYPWGPGFDVTIPVSVLAGHREEPQAVSASTVDIGPYGHRHMGGNVREWVADVPADDDPSARLLNAMIVGGGWTSGRPELFRSDSIERVEARVVNPVIGMRLLMEIP